MPTYSSALLPTTNGLTFGSGALRWTIYAQDLDIAGTFTAASRLGIKNFEDIRFADQFTGANVTAQIDAALTDISSVGLVVVPSSMGAGNATSISSGKAILDLRSGVPKFFTNNSVSSAAWQLNNDGTVTSQGVKSVTANPSSAGFIRAAKSDAINFRNNANGADVNGLSLDSSDIVQVGGAAGAKTIGAMAISGAFTGVTNLSYSGQIVSSVATGTAPFSVTSTTVVPNLNVATLNGVVVSGAPTTGQILTATGVATAGWASGSGYKLENIQYTPNTFVSSAGGAFFTYSLPANEMAVGQALRFTVTGTWTSTSGVTRTYTFTLKAGSTTLGTVAMVAAAGAITNGHWSYEFLAICTAAGSGGTLEVQNITPVSNLNGMTQPTTHTVTANSATIAFDTTSSQSLTFNVAQTNDATTATTGRQWMVERLG